MRHQLFAYGRDQVARLVEVFMFSRFRGHIGYLTDVYEIFDVQFKLTLYISETSVGVFLLAYLNETDTLDLFE